MTDTKDLIERLEAATADADEQRRLMQLAWTIMFPMPEGPQFEGVGEWGAWWDRKRRFIAMLDAEAYESAALTLVGDTAYELSVSPGQTRQHAGVWSMERECFYTAQAATPALSIVIAALRARSEGEG